MKGSSAKARWGGLIALLALSILSGGWLLRRKAAPEGTVYQQARLFENVVASIHTHYIDSLGEGELYQTAAKALVSSLRDPYAELLTRESYRQYQRQMAGTEVDVGSALEASIGGARSAFAPGDVILSIDGKSTVGWSARRLEEALAGGTGTYVTVVVRPWGSSTPVVRRLTRTVVRVPAASPGIMLGSGVGYIELRRISDGAAMELRRAVDRLVSDGMTALVLDLRGDPGGLINEGVRVASLFLRPGDTVAVSKGRSQDHSKVYLAGPSGGWGDLRLAVLVNHGTASSAELIAGALQDHDRAVILGTPTFGKGVLQTTYPLGEEIAIKLTTARWYTPSGRTVQRPRADGQGALGNRTPALAPRRFRTAGGRSIPDASGILPDLMVRGTPRSDGERVFLATLGEDIGLFRSVLANYAEDLKKSPFAPKFESFRVSDEMRNQVYDRLQMIGLEVPRTVFDNASAYVDEQLGYEITRELFGSAAEARRRARSDRQMQAAVRLLRRASTQEQVITLAALERARGTGR
ncbi:MAG TPA: S41 family peptidase [Gemmatimonadales bacterium]|jgi:carboxyl-terminal processing protease|nr:S41 family peptidase [Gemmatimonadales bacterium]